MVGYAQQGKVPLPGESQLGLRSFGRSVGGLYLSRTDLNFGLLLSRLYLGKLPSGLYLEKVHCT